jgi:tetratricopeptide (TPR) repeat protein
MNIIINPKLLLIALLIASLAISLSCRATETPDAANVTTDAANNTANNTASSDAATPPREDSTDTAATRGSADLIAKGVKLFEEYRNEEAMQAYKNALELDPDNGEAHYRIALVHADTGEREAAEKSYKEAVERLEKVVRKNEDDANAYRYLALSHAKLGDHAMP